MLALAALLALACPVLGGTSLLEGHGGLDPVVVERAQYLLKNVARQSSPLRRPLDGNNSAVLSKVSLPASLLEEAGAYCLDGSPFSYYLRPASNPANRDKFVFFLQGGGLCVEPADCYERMLTPLGSSSQWEAVISSDNVAGDAHERNPFHDWNFVYLRYCTGDTWVGTSTHRRPQSLGFYFSGRNCLQATMLHLQQTAGLGGASQLVLSGTSAGGIGVFNNCDWFAGRFPDARVRCVPQAGQFFAANTHAEWQERLGWENVTMNEIAGLYVGTMFNASMDQSCVADHETKGLPAVLCWDVGTVLPYITTPTFVVQNSWDRLQIDDILCWQDNILPCPKAWLRDFKQRTLGQLKSLAHRSSSGIQGAWVPSCFSHTLNTCTAGACSVQNHTMGQAIAAWIAADAAELPLLLIDDCSSSKDPSYQPCNSVCTGCNE